MKHLPFFQFARDLCGYHYLHPSVLNREMGQFAEKCFNAWIETRWKTNKRAKLMALIPRKGRKSTMFTQSGPAYLLGLNPNLSIVVSSEKKERSNDFMGSTARILSGEAKEPICSAGCTLESRPWVAYQGSWKAEDRKWRDDAIVVSARTHMQRKEPSIVTSSVEIGYTGGAPDCIFIDDPMSPESHNETWMNSVIRHYEGMGPVGMPNALYFLCMTRYDDMDLAGHIERTEGWHVCEAEEAETCIRRGACSVASDSHPEPWHVLFRRAMSAEEVSIDESIWPTSFFKSEQKKYPGFFAAQYLNDPWHNPDASFQPEDFVYSEAAPADCNTILTTDTAWKDPDSRKTERGGDFSVFVIARHHVASGRVYFTRIERGRWTQGEWGDQLVKILRAQREIRQPVSRMTYEDIPTAKGAIHEAIRSACQRWGEVAPALIQIQRSRNVDDKIRRIKASAQYFQNHWAIMVRPCKALDGGHGACGIPGCGNFHIARNELLKLGATMYDDCADSLADHFHPEVYHAPSVRLTDSYAPITRPFDDILKPNIEESYGVSLTLDANDRPMWVPNDSYYPREPV